MFYPGMVDGFESANAAFYLGEGCLYDSLHLDYQELDGRSNGYGFLHFINSATPGFHLADTMTVRIKLTKPVSQKQRVLMQWSDGDDFEIKKPAWLGDWATASFQEFWKFQPGTGHIAACDPSSRNVSENANLQRSSRIAVLVQDNYKKIKNFRGHPRREMVTVFQ